MIHILPSFALATLVDGRVIMKKYQQALDQSWAETAIESEPVRIYTAPHWISSYSLRAMAVLTKGDRILTGHEPNDLYDITEEIHKQLNTDTVLSQNICVRESAVFAWAGSIIALVNISCPDCRHVFDSEIDLVSIDNDWIVVKTKDNRLFVISIWKQRYSIGMRTVPIYFGDRSELAFHDVDGISEIHTGERWMILLMKDKSAYGCNYRESQRLGLPELLVYPKGETVSKIVDAGRYVVSVTSTNNYYYHDAQGTFNLSLRPYPISLGPLQYYFNDNIFPGPWGSIIIQSSHTHGCVTHLVRLTTMYNDRIKHLQHLDGLSIVSITCEPSCCCLTMNDGSVFWLRDTLSGELTVTRDTFFDANLLAVSNTAAMIRSTGSILND